MRETFSVRGAPFALALGVALLAAPAAWAVPVEFRFTGTVEFVEGPVGLVGGVTVGAGITGSYVVESATPDLNPDPQLGTYFGAATRFDAQTQGLVLEVESPQSGQVQVIDGAFGPEDQYDVNVTRGSVSVGSVVAPFVSIQLTMESAAPSQWITSDALPLTGPPDFGAFENVLAILIQTSFEPGATVLIDATLDSLEAIPVPEPAASSALALAVLAGLAGSRWSRMGAGA